jgi:hypothetical protein
MTTRSTDDTPATDDPQHATFVGAGEGTTRTDGTTREPAGSEDDVASLPATPGAQALPSAGAGTQEHAHDQGASLTDPPAGAHASTEGDQAWLALQGTFVDDPQVAVRQAGERVVREFEELRTRLEAGSTEDLRTAFQRYRSLHEALQREAAR